MTPERWQQVKRIFNSAIEYPPDERKSFLTEACSNDSLLISEVESLIASHERSGEFIDEPAYQFAAESLAAEVKNEVRAGQRIGDYEIISFISRGGMGEVYAAQDKRLNRKVALKLLPTSFTRDDDRLRRFDQEARAASALNHPNIITIYEIFQVGSTHAIATEFVEGETLRDRLLQSPIGLNEALHISIQIADALAAAHKVGVIHRDVKPENVMLRPDGYAKVLDFGLAKLTEAAAPAVAAEAPTVQVRTQSGIVMGTAGYMSPEQARGLTVDGRSDIFSLGAVIYEMVASRKPFEGDTPSDTLASILKTEPTPLSRLAPHAPAELNRIVTKSLRKDREERYQVVKDLLLDLKALKQELEFQTKLQGSSLEDPYHTEIAENVTTDATKRQAIDTRTALSSISDSLSLEIKKHKFRTVALLLSVLLLAGLGVWATYRMVHKEERAEHFWNIKLSRLTNSGNVIDALISPDGKYMVYALSDRSSQSLWIRQVSTANDKEVVPAAPVGYFGLTFSPDGTELYYAVKANLDAGTLYRIPVLGGIPSKVLEKIDAPISFSPDEKRFVLIRGNYPNRGESALVIANIDGTDERVLATRKLPERFSPIFFTGPSWSPDGKFIAATVAKVGGLSRVSTFAVADGKEQVLTREGWPFAARVEWLRDVSGVIVVAGDHPGSSQQWIVSYPSGERRQVTNDLNTYRTIGLTRDGQKFSTVQAEGLVNLWVVPDGDAAKATRLPTGNFGFYAGYGNSLFWTPDGRVVFVSNEDGGPDIWIMQPDGQNRKQLTSNDTANVSPSVSADGKLILFVSAHAGNRNVWRMNIDGSNPIRLTNGLADNFPSFSPDGKWVIYSKLEGPIPTVWKVPVDGGEPVQITSHVANAAQISPDGKLMAYSYPDSSDPYAPSNRIDLVDLTDGSVIRTLKLSVNSFIASTFQWSPDGKAVHYVANANNVSNIWSQPIDGSPPKQITDFKELLISGFGWSRDGKTLVCSRGQLIRDAVLITDQKK